MGVVSIVLYCTLVIQCKFGLQWTCDVSVQRTHYSNGGACYTILWHVTCTLRGYTVFKATFLSCRDRTQDIHKKGRSLSKVDTKSVALLRRAPPPLSIVFYLPSTSIYQQFIILVWLPLRFYLAVKTRFSKQRHCLISVSILNYNWWVRIRKPEISKT